MHASSWRCRQPRRPHTPWRDTLQLEAHEIFSKGKGRRTLTTRPGSNHLLSNWHLHICTHMHACTRPRFAHAFTGMYSIHVHPSSRQPTRTRAHPARHRGRTPHAPLGRRRGPSSLARSLNTSATNARGAPPTTHKQAQQQPHRRQHRARALVWWAQGVVWSPCGTGIRVVVVAVRPRRGRSGRGTSLGAAEAAQHAPHHTRTAATTAAAAAAAAAAAMLASGPKHGAAVCGCGKIGRCAPPDGYRP